MRLIPRLVGLALLPTAALTALAALETLARLAARSSAAAPFFAGAGLSLAAWLAARAAQSERGLAGLLWSASARIYVFGHELTHALAAWSMGAKVHAFHVGETGGHVDLSQSNAFVALAPYCVPLYALLVIAAYRAALWLRPGLGGGGSSALFLALLGAALSFHLLKTVEVLLSRRQPDLAAAGGALFSASCIALANGLFLLLLAKMLFPRAVSLSGSLGLALTRSSRFWLSAWACAAPIGRRLAARLRRA